MTADEKSVAKTIVWFLLAVFITMLALANTGCKATERDCTQQKSAYKHKKKVQRQLHYDMTNAKY